MHLTYPFSLISGNGLGVSYSSFTQIGSALPSRDFGVLKMQSFINVKTGNLIIFDHKLIVQESNFPLEFYYVYNSQAQKVADIWRFAHRRFKFLPQPNQTLSAILIEKDGHEPVVRIALTDITELKQYENRLNEITLQDPLTGLPNRMLLNERLQGAMAKALDEGCIGGLLLLNLDRFKEVNDILGHGHGDHLLVHCGKRLLQLVRTYDTVARLGADEFAVLLPQIRDVADLVAIAKKINAAMSQPFHIGDQPIFVTCSIGIAQFPVEGVRANELLQHADSALSEAKVRGRSGYYLYSAELTERARERAQLGIALRRAEPDGQLELYYQPKVDLSDGTWIGAEALLRWNHPKVGLVTPDRFIGLAEESGLIVGMGTWVLTKACLAAQEWNTRLGWPFKVAVNLSPVQFRQDDLVTTVRSVLSTTGCEPGWLELEITESLLLGDIEDTIARMVQLKSEGRNSDGDETETNTGLASVQLEDGPQGTTWRRK